MENESKKMAWFPAPYLDKLEDDDEAEDEDEIDGNSERGMCISTVLYPIRTLDHQHKACLHSSKGLDTFKSESRKSWL